MTRALRHLLLCMLTLLPLAGCVHTASTPDVIASTAEMYVAADSVAINGVGVRPSRLLEQLPDTNPALISDLPVADWAFALEILHPGPSTARQIWLDQALLSPEASARSLRAISPDSDPYWGLAAWEVYCASGSTDWLIYAYERLSASLIRRIGNRNLVGTPLFSPAASTLQTLEMNVILAATAEVAVEMAREIGYSTQAEAPLPRLARQLPFEINRLLWWPAESNYRSALCSYPYSVPVPTFSPGGTALAIICGVATPDMGRMAMHHTLTTPLGVAETYPLTSGEHPQIDPVTQLLWAKAAAQLGVTPQLNHAIGALLAPLGKPGSESLGAALALRVFAGIRLQPKGLAFEPCVPASCPGTKRIRGLHWRDGVMDITIAGTGNKISTLLVDGTPVKGNEVVLPTSGRHSIAITLANNNIDSESEELPELTVESRLLPTPHPQWSTPRTATVAGGPFTMWLNGVAEERFDGPDLTLPDLPDRLIQVNLYASDEGTLSLPSRAHLVIPPGLATEFDVEGDTLARVRAAGSGVLVAQVCYAPTAGEGAVQMAVNDSLQAVMSLVGARADSLWTSPAPLMLSKGENRISFSQHTSSTNKILHLRLIPLP